MRRKRLYIPITRSGSSIIASILTQMLQESSRLNKERVNQRLARGEITPNQAAFQKNPGCFTFIILLPISFLLVLLMKSCG